MYILDWTGSFEPLYGQPILIPSNMVFYRGYDKAYPVISDRVTHFGSKETASGYARYSNTELGAFTNTRLLRVFDFRYMKLLLKQLFSSRTDASFEHLEPMARVTLSYGLCSLRDQISLMQKLVPSAAGLFAVEAWYKRDIDGKEWADIPLDINPFTPDGIRVAETNNDAQTLHFVKHIFGDIVDGFIAPKMPSPFHVEKDGFVSAELVLFDPRAAGIQPISMTQVPNQKMTITQVLNGQSHTICLKLKNHHECSYRSRATQRGGGGGVVPQTDAWFDDLAKKKSNVVKEAAAMEKAARYFKRHLKYIDYTAPDPSVPLSPWVALSAPC